MAHEKGIKKIYYVDVRPGKDSYETDIRDEYAIDDKGKIYLDREGTEAYHELLKLYDNVLKDYKRGKITSLDKTEFKDYTKLYNLETFEIVKKKDFKNYDYLGLISIQVSWFEFIFFDVYEYIEQKLDEIWKAPK